MTRCPLLLLAMFMAMMLSVSGALMEWDSIDDEEFSFPLVKRSARPPSKQANRPKPGRKGPLREKLPPRKMELTRPIDAMVLIQGDKSSGHGFTAKIKDKFFIVTNINVVAPNQKQECTTSNGETLKPIGRFFS